MYIRVVIVFCFASLISFSQPIQTTNVKLALQYFEQKEYEKANEYFEDLFDKQPYQWFNKYYASLVGAKNYNKAEKICKKVIKASEVYNHHYVHLGNVYALQNEIKKEKECYEKALKELNPTQPYIGNLANTFLEFQKYNYAIDTYLKARKYSPDYPFYYEIADIYKQKNDLKAMVNEYLDALEFRETELQTVQINLQNNLGYDETDGGINNPILKQELQKRIQKSPDKIILCEFLIFIQKQQKDFDGAFVQSKALDKRLKENGSRIYDLAKICTSNSQWQTAQRCYEYLLEKGSGSPFYDLAIIDGLNAEYMAIKQVQATKESLLQLEIKYQSAIEKYKGTNLSLTLIKNLSLLQAYYLDKAPLAITQLENLIATSGINATEKADLKIQLADINLLKGDIWEASLLYSQVEKDFKYEPIGQEAKFKNAKLSFYAGDFTWAKTQATVLKGATSKLIANDALDLSLIISDAIGIDTNDLPLKLFASAELLGLQHKYQQAITRLDSINLLFSTHTLGDDISYKKAKFYIETNNLLQAEAMYKNILEFFPTELYGDDAQFKLAELYEKLSNKEKAQQAYKDLLTNYSGSIYVVEARKRYRLLRGDALNN